MIELKDNELKKIVKKAAHKKSLVTGIISFIMVILVVGIGLGGYMFYNNYGVFQGEEVASLPDGKIRSNDAEFSPVSLLMSNYGSMDFNATGKKINVYLDFYEKDKLKRSESINNIELSSSSALNGTLFWGIQEMGETGPDDNPITLLKTSMQTNSGVGVNGRRINFKEWGFDLESSMSGYGEGYDEKLEKEKKYLLQIWKAEPFDENIEDKQQGVGFYSDVEEEFKQENLRETYQTLLLYVVFE